MQSTSGNPWWPLVLLTHAAAGLYFAYETAGALAPDLQDEMGFTNQQIGLMYSAYSIPVIGSIFVSEFLNRKLGASKCILLFSFCIALGTFVVAIAPNFQVMFAGQIIYGAGSSPMYLTSTIVLGKWFGNDAAAKKKVSIAFGLVFAWCRLFSFAAFMLLPIISSHLSLRFALGFSAFICATSFVAGAFFFVIDYHKKYTTIEMPDEVALQQTEESTKKQHSTKSTESLSLLNSADDGNERGEGEGEGEGEDGSERGEEEKTKENNEDINGDRVVATFVVGAEGTSTAIDEDESGSREEEEEEDDEREEKSKNKSKKNKNRDRDIDMEKGMIEIDNKEIIIIHKSIIKKWKQDIMDTYKVMKTFPLAYWLILILVIIFISDLYTCTAFLTQYLHEEWSLEKETAAAITSLVCLTNVITSPIAGWLAGYTGWKVKFIILGAVNLLLIHFFFTTKIIPVVVLVCALGLTQSIMDTNLTPSFVFLIPRKNYSIALALCSICYNTGLLLFPMICGFLRDAMENWNGVNMAFITASIFAVLFSLILKIVDLRNGNVLDLPFNKS